MDDLLLPAAGMILYMLSWWAVTWQRVSPLLVVAHFRQHAYCRTSE